MLCSLCFLLSQASCSKSNLTVWHCVQALTKSLPEGTGARRGAEGAEKDCMADLLSCFFSALSALSARKKILATMRDSDGLQCKERIDKN
jgi:hypothetical protein